MACLVAISPLCCFVHRCGVSSQYEGLGLPLPAAGDRKGTPLPIIIEKIRCGCVSRDLYGLFVVMFHMISQRKCRKR